MSADKDRELPETRETSRITDATDGHGDENTIVVGIDRGRVTVSGTVSLTTGSASRLLKNIGIAIAHAARWKGSRDAGAPGTEG